MKKFYFLLDGNIIIDAIDYEVAGYTEVELDQLSLPPGINGRYYRLIDDEFVFDEALKETQIDEITQKTLINLGNIDNTSDLAKPVSTAQQTALNLKANLNSPTFTGTVSGISKTSVGLGNVDNVKQDTVTASSITIATASWTSSTAPFISEQSITEILSTDVPIIDVVMSGTYETDEAISKAWGYIYRAVTTASAVIFYATEKPTVSLPIQLKVVR